MVGPVLEISRQSLGGLLREGTAMLVRSGVENAAQESVWLLEAALGVCRLDLHLKEDMSVAPDDLARARALLARRAAREPLQYLLGTQEFCGLEFQVGPAVLIPRPETEVLVREVIGFAHGASAPIIADVGTGSGCIVVAVARALPAATLIATDVSGAALGMAIVNARRHGVEGRVRFLEGDLEEPLARMGVHGQVSALVCNPPYISDSELDGLQPEVGGYEPAAALKGGPDGLAFHRRLLEAAPKFLKAGGLLALEVGRGQAPIVARWASRAGGFRNVRIVEDQAGIERVLCATRSE
jgi:release factor glutamine methyltransferase